MSEDVDKVYRILLLKRIWINSFLDIIGSEGKIWTASVWKQRSALDQGEMKWIMEDIA
jgi:hypothetical protein